MLYVLILNLDSFLVSFIRYASDVKGPLGWEYRPAAPGALWVSSCQLIHGWNGSVHVRRPMSALQTLFRGYADDVQIAFREEHVI